jgi:hypothetical protein
MGTRNVDSAKGAQNVEAMLNAALRSREGVVGGGVGGMGTRIAPLYTPRSLSHTLSLSNSLSRTVKHTLSLSHSLVHTLQHSLSHTLTR